MMLPFAPGTHLLIDFWGARRLDEIDFIELALNQAALACGATVLAIHLHSFGEKAGITGVAMLAESHISIHSWPEIDYVALDVFMCGSSNPHLALPVLRDFFKPRQVSITEAARGRVMSSDLISR
jgi:S-adenosylmethionine decarboxylase